MVGMGEERASSTLCGRRQMGERRRRWRPGEEKQCIAMVEAWKAPPGCEEQVDEGQMWVKLEELEWNST